MPGSQDRLEALGKELAGLKEKADGLKAQWRREKDLIDAAKALKDPPGCAQGRGAVGGAARRPGEGGRDPLRQAHRARTRGRSELAAELAAVQKAGKMLKEEVDEEDVAEVVSQVDRHPGGQDAGGRRGAADPDGRPACPAACRPGRGAAGRVRHDPAGPGRPAGRRPAAGLVHLSRPDRRRQDRTGPGPGRVPVRLREGHGPAGHVRIHGEARRRRGSSAPLPAMSATRRAAS